MGTNGRLKPQVPPHCRVDLNNNDHADCNYTTEFPFSRGQSVRPADPLEGRGLDHRHLGKKRSNQALGWEHAGQLAERFDSGDWL